MLPQLHDEARRIALTLDEREREEHARLRRARARRAARDAITDGPDRARSVGMSRARDGTRSRSATAHELVLRARGLDRRPAGRGGTSRATRWHRLKLQADHLIAEAEAQAAEEAQRRRAAILSAARAEAARLTEAGIRRAADLTAIADPATRRRTSPQSSAAVLPQRTRSSPGEVS